MRNVDLVEEDKNSRLRTNVLGKGIFFHKPVYLAVCLTVKGKSGIMGLLEEMNNLKGRRLLNCKVRLIQSHFVL